MMCETHFESVFNNLNTFSLCSFNLEEAELMGNLLKEKLKSELCIGTFLKIPRPEVVDILALSGFDFIICDMEHAQISESEAREVIKTGVARGIPIIVRLPDPAQGLVNRLLEAGAAGIQIPRLKSSQDINELNSFMHYPPEGKRSVGNANLLADYGAIPLQQYLTSENKRVLTVGQFETVEMERPCEPLFEGLDVAFIGPTDLCVDFGVTGNLDDPRVQERLNEIELHAKKSNTTLGAFAANSKDAQKFIDKGYRFLAVGGDVSLLMKGAKSLVADLKEKELAK